MGVEKELGIEGIDIDLQGMSIDVIKEILIPEMLKKYNIKYIHGYIENMHRDRYVFSGGYDLSNGKDYHYSHYIRLPILDEDLAANVKQLISSLMFDSKVRELKLNCETDFIPEEEYEEPEEEEEEEEISDTSEVKINIDEIDPDLINDVIGSKDFKKHNIKNINGRVYRLGLTSDIEEDSYYRFWGEYQLGDDCYVHSQGGFYPLETPRMALEHFCSNLIFYAELQRERLEREANKDEEDD